jgi:Protein of unknown function (DUF2507)
LENENNKEQVQEPTIPIFGYEIIRDILIPEILGKNTPDILYYGGKQLSRKFPLISQDEFSSFFHEAGWGILTVLEQKKHEVIYELSGELVSRRISLKSDVSFKMEAGFLAEQLQLQKKVITEAAYEIQKRAKTVKIIVRWDDKDSIE